MKIIKYITKWKIRSEITKVVDTNFMDKEELVSIYSIFYSEFF